MHTDDLGERKKYLKMAVDNGCVAARDELESHLKQQESRHAISVHRPRGRARAHDASHFPIPDPLLAKP